MYVKDRERERERELLWCKGRLYAVDRGSTAREGTATGDTR